MGNCPVVDVTLRLDFCAAYTKCIATLMLSTFNLSTRVSHVVQCCTADLFESAIFVVHVRVK